MNYEFDLLMGAPYRGGTLLMHDKELLSPHGNRVTQIDLVKGQSATLPMECSFNARTLALSPDGRMLFVIDEKGRALIVNRVKRVLLHRFSFKDTVRAAKFSPGGEYLAVAVGRLVQVWTAPERRKSLAPLRLHRTYGHAHADVTCLDWSPCGTWLAFGSRDLTVRVVSLDPVAPPGSVPGGRARALKGRRAGATPATYRPPTLGGFKEAPAGVWFCREHTQRAAQLAGKAPPELYTLSRDGALFAWSYVLAEGGEEEEGLDQEEGDGEPEAEEGGQDAEDGDPNAPGPFSKPCASAGPPQTRTYFKPGAHWRLTERHYVEHRGAAVSASAFDPGSGLLAVGLSSGSFSILELPELAVVHSLSLGRERVSSLSWGAGGAWLAAGCAAAGQLAVWEWRSEGHVLKQQGHADAVGCCAYAPDGATLASGAADGKVKLWTPASGFCAVTFGEAQAPITGLAWLPSGQGLVSSSLDGAVRAHDLVRYRCFRTLTSASARQWGCVAVDAGGDMVVAGARDTFALHVWSLRTGRELDVLAAHEGPVSALAFAPGSSLLASASWDRTVRTWNVFDSKGSAEALRHGHEVLTLAWRPDGRQLASATLDGSIYLWQPHEAELQGVIPGARDLASGRRVADRQTAENAQKGRAFHALAYAADGALLLAGGNSRHVCVYDAAERVLLRRVETTRNLSLDGVLDRLSSRNVTEAGPAALLQLSDSEEEQESAWERRGRGGKALPGTVASRPPARVFAIALSPTGASWTAATQEGLALFRRPSAGAGFDPTDLTEEATPKAVLRALAGKAHLRALLLALRLGDAALLRRCLESCPPSGVRALAAALPPACALGALEAAAAALEQGAHVELSLRWVRALLSQHAEALREREREARGALRGLGTVLARLQEDVGGVAQKNLYVLRALRVMAGGKRARAEEEEA